MPGGCLWLFELGQLQAYLWQDTDAVTLIDCGSVGILDPVQPAPPDQLTPRLASALPSSRTPARSAAVYSGS